MTYKQEVKSSAFRDPKELAAGAILICVLGAQEALVVEFCTHGHSVIPTTSLRAVLKVVSLTAIETLV